MEVINFLGWVDSQVTVIVLRLEAIDIKLDLPRVLLIYGLAPNWVLNKYRKVHGVQSMDQIGLFENYFYQIIWFGLVSLFKGISNFIGHLMPKLSLSKNSRDTVQSIAKEFVPFSKSESERTSANGIWTCLLIYKALLLRCGTKPNEWGAQWDSNPLV